MNIPLARKVQESILDLTNDFDMNSWGHCIGGHCRMIQEANHEFHPIHLENWGAVAYFAHALGITNQEGHELFSSEPLTIRSDRAGAVARIEALIRRYEARAIAAAPLATPTEPPSLRGKPRSRSARAALPATFVLVPALVPAPPSPADMARIDTIIREVEEEALVSA